jgi:hypothetical protein
MPVHVHDEMGETEMLEDVGVNVRRSDEIHVSQHREEHMFRQCSQHCVFYREEFRNSPEGEGLDSHSRPLISKPLAWAGCKDLDAFTYYHVKHGVQETEDGPCIAFGTEEVNVTLGIYM